MQRCFRRIGGAHVVVHQQELLELRMIESSLEADLPLGETGRLRRSVGVESRSFDVAAARPESRTAHLVRVGFASNRVGSRTLGALLPEKRVTARSKLPQKKCTGLTLPRKPARNSFKT